VRGHVCFRDDPALGALSLPAPPTVLSHGSRLPEARSPSPPIAPPRAVHAKRRPALLWIWAAAQRLLQLTFRRTDTLPSIRFSRFAPPRGYIAAVNVEPALVSSVLLTAPSPSPLEEGSRTLRATTALPKPARRRCKRAAKRDLESRFPIGTPLAGDASIRPPFAAMAVGKQRWTARAE